MEHDLRSENRAYWIERAPGYSAVNKEELTGIQHETWPYFLENEISGQFPDRLNCDIRVLDVGAGPGFISIVLCELGCKVTAFDFAESMLLEARQNAGELAEKIDFVQGDAMALPFADGSFDVVVSRNLTWNLPDPEEAYREWLRVLVPGGLMMVFDANWYTYLHNEEKRAAYKRDRENVAANSFEDYNIGKNFDKMERIAGKLPMTFRERPAWDKDFLEGLHVSEVKTTGDIGSRLYSDKEKVNYSSTPLFLIRVVKGT